MSEQIEKNAETPEGATSELSAGLGAWLPINTAPKDGTRIIVCSDTGNVWCNVEWVVRKRAGERWEHFTLGAIRFNPTHWMPIPKAPSAELRGASRNGAASSERSERG